MNIPGFAGSTQATCCHFGMKFKQLLQPFSIIFQTTIQRSANNSDVTLIHWRNMRRSLSTSYTMDARRSLILRILPSAAFDFFDGVFCCIELDLFLCGCQQIDSQAI